MILKDVKGFFASLLLSLPVWAAMTLTYYPINLAFGIDLPMIPSILIISLTIGIFISVFLHYRCQVSGFRCQRADENVSCATLHAPCAMPLTYDGQHVPFGHRVAAAEIDSLDGAGGRSR